MVYFRKALGNSISKMMIPVVKFKIVKSGYGNPHILGYVAAYTQYKYIYFHKCTFPTLCPKGTQKPSNLQSSPKCWHDISNINIYIQLTYTPQMVGSIYPIQIYIFINVHSQPCARRAHRNPPTYSHPPSVGMIYPISTNINKLRVHECVRLTSELYCVV